MPSDDPRFNCPACGKSYRWKPELAGRSAKCACGAKLVVPTSRPAAAAPVATPATPAVTSPVGSAKTSAVKPLRPAAASNCPICKSPVVAGAVLCVKCGYNFKTGKRLAAVIVETDEDDGDDGEQAKGIADNEAAEKPSKSPASPDTGAASAG